MSRAVAVKPFLQHFILISSVKQGGSLSVKVFVLFGIKLLRVFGGVSLDTVAWAWMPLASNRFLRVRNSIAGFIASALPLLWSRGAVACGVFGAGSGFRLGWRGFHIGGGTGRWALVLWDLDNFLIFPYFLSS